MQEIHYGTHVLVVADDLATQVSLACTEFASAGRAIAVPVNCYIGSYERTVQIVVGSGIPLLIATPADPDDRPEPSDTLWCWSWIRDEVESLQAED